MGGKYLYTKGYYSQTGKVISVLRCSQSASALADSTYFECGVPSASSEADLFHGTNDLTGFRHPPPPPPGVKRLKFFTGQPCLGSSLLTDNSQEFSIMWERRSTP